MPRPTPAQSPRRPATSTSAASTRTDGELTVRFPIVGKAVSPEVYAQWVAEQGGTLEGVAETAAAEPATSVTLAKAD